MKNLMLEGRTRKELIKMITDETLGLKIAENDEEGFWEQCRKRCEDEIKNNEREIIINKHVLSLCEEKLKTKGL